MRTEKKISEATYSRENNKQKIEDYYNIMSKFLNDLEQAGELYALSEEKK